MQKSYIWSLPTRVFHALFAIFILLAFLTDDDNLLLYHAIIGYGIFILLLFRVGWGLFGPKHSKFKDFPLSIKETKKFLGEIINNSSKYVGHNPLASFVMVAILATVFLAILSGILTYGIQEGKGIASFLNSSFFKEMELFEEIHEFFANFLILLVVIHLGGVLSDWIFHGKNKTLNSIANGYKITEKKETIHLNLFQKLFALLMAVLFIGFLIYSLSTPKNVLTASVFKPINYEQENELFVDECASCHTLYPPSLLPKKSWIKLMADLENHFGDDASLDEEDTKIILDYLKENSAETSTMQASLNFLNSIKDKDIIAMTHTDFWKRKHKEIPKEMFDHEQIRSKANCKACHLDIEKGLIENENIKSLSSFN